LLIIESSQVSNLLSFVSDKYAYYTQNGSQLNI